MTDKGNIWLTIDCRSDDWLYRFNLNVYVSRDGEDYIAYCPALDMTEAADTMDSAVSGFKEHFLMYFEECVEQGTLIADLEAHNFKDYTIQAIKPL